MKRVKRPDYFIRVANFPSVLIFTHSGLLCTGTRATLNNVVIKRNLKKALRGRLVNKQTEKFLKKRKKALRA